jgi:Oxidoreductase molybdopterin binding domain
MRHPWVNVAVLLLLAGQLTTGLLGLTNGNPDRRWLYWFHDIGAWAIVAILAWKVAVVVNSLSRRKRAPEQRPLFLVLVGLLAATLLTGFAWTSVGRITISGYSLMTVHHVLAYATVAILVFHVASMRFIFGVGEATDRRAFLRFAGASVAGVAAWQVSGALKAFLDLPGATRRFTGSYETGSFSGRFPTVSWFSDDPERIDEGAWRLRVDGDVERELELTYDDLLTMSDSEREALIDCTGGWYSRQDWQGVPVAVLLDRARPREGAGSVTFESVTGYDRRFSLEEAGRYLLATGVAGERLSHGHGFPCRLVAFNQRGFNWVKWVRRITVNAGGDGWQTPVPLQ